MKIILQKNSGRYGFEVISDANRVIYASLKQHFLIPFVQPSYRYAWEACKDAWKLARKYPYHVQSLKFSMYDMEQPTLVDVSAESMITDHYLSIWRDLRVKAKGMTKSEDRKKGYQEVAKVIKEIGNVQEKITDREEKNKLAKILHRFNMLVEKHYSKEKAADKPEKPSTPPMVTASVITPEAEEVLSSEIIEDALYSYAERVCQAIQDKHNDCYYSINPDTQEITILDFNNAPILKVRANENLSIESIIPVGKMNKIYPVHSVEFYQKYWKPIAESIGHFYLPHSDVLLKIDESTLPDVPTKDQSFTIEGWKCKDREDTTADISFRGEKPIWMVEINKQVKTASAKSQPVNSKAKCIDPKLKSIYGKEGIAIQKLLMPDMVIIEVMFPEGLGTVRLRYPEQVELIPLGA